MAITLAGLRQNVRDHLDEATASYWTDAEINRSIGRRQLNLWTRIMQLRKSFFVASSPYTLTLVSGQNKYTLPSTLYRAKSIRTTSNGSEGTVWVAKDPSEPIFIEGWRSDVVVANPTIYYYAIMGPDGTNIQNSIWVSPTPQAALTAIIEYYTMPIQVSADTDTFGLLDPFLDYIEYSATADLLRKGPVGDAASWAAMAESSWQGYSILIDTPRNDQSADLVEGAFD